MRMAFCYCCRTLSKLPDYKGSNPDNDAVLADWIERHLHGFHHMDTGPDPELREDGRRHPGGRVFVSETPSQFDPTTPYGEGSFESDMVEEIRAELQQMGLQMQDYRDELREDAVKCHHKHGQPDLNNGKPCIDYRASSKKIGSRYAHMSLNGARDLAYLCTHCPYESSVTVAIRSRRGDYRR